MNSRAKLIAVIGAGVTGLQTSISLRRAGYRVVVLAKHFPGDNAIEYTSPWAGAHWRSHANRLDLEQQKWDTETYEYMRDIIEKEAADPTQCALSGLALCQSQYFSASICDPWYSNTVMDYREMPRNEIQAGFKHGHTYTSIIINAPMYLEHLLRTARQLGVQDIHTDLPCSSNLTESLTMATKTVAAHFDDKKACQISAFVNATGISALSFVPDSGVYPVKGQTVTVAGGAKQITTIEANSSHDGVETPIIYVLPRPHSNTTILGGTKEVGNWSAEPDAKITEEILRRAKEWAPELLDEVGNFKVISVQVGLRPARQGGVRLEMEKVGDFVVCHTYGHAGAGYQNSVGSASKVVRLLQESLGKMSD